MTGVKGSGLPNGLAVTILGAGAWGTTLAILAHEAGNDVSLVAHREEAARFMAAERRHPSSLHGVSIPGPIRITHDAPAALATAGVVVVAVPTQQLRSFLAPLAGPLRGKTIISVIKGLELESCLRPSEVIAEVLGTGTPLAVVSGPNLSAEIAAGHPATTVIASTNTSLAERLRGVFHSRRFRVYTGRDVVGAELGGALKNIIAIGAGLADGLRAGDNAKAAFMTRGIAEIARLGVACGADAITFAGLTGIGDLIATCASPLSRNHRVGEALARGMALPDILASMSEVAEGVSTTRAARQLGATRGVELPITDQLYRVMFEGVSPADAIARLMERDPKHELLDLGG